MCILLNEKYSIINSCTCSKMQNIYICDVLTCNLYIALWCLLKTKQLSTIKSFTTKYSVDDHFKYSFAYYECSGFINVYISNFTLFTISLKNVLQERNIIPCSCTLMLILLNSCLCNFHNCCKLCYVVTLGYWE